MHTYIHLYVYVYMYMYMYMYIAEAVARLPPQVIYFFIFHLNFQLSNAISVLFSFSYIS